ncbi:MAG: hypothetical protein A2270_05660 [Elusimicrobia bacterium RIFOXYA12_FULL_51_18]|nr:MAG: hypothetical protein A2270_05660 [Elusimicrobia bacterium RIFOXYA12_FULL_51_18]OGS28691.1 MAG: hypothetical protein A2218_11005 [Elusimicrobia bacterium RIFOXYA2_FULL_53_38]
MKILLVKPKWFVKGGLYRPLENIKFTPLSLGIIAALSPAHEITVADGDWDEVPYEKNFDLVGITVSTFTSERAYGIADRFRAKGAKVVMGGPHPSLLPEECLAHADAVVVGEAEYVWGDILADAPNGSLKKIYRGDRPTEMKDVPAPRRELLNDNSWMACVQATRGCPNKCLYCYLPEVPWHAYRKREIDSVYAEIKNIKQKVVFFVDDNLFADPAYAMALFDRLAPLKKLFSLQTPTTIAKDPAMVEKMAKAGCFHVQMGFQTSNPDSLKWAGIAHNHIEDYKKTVALLHRHKILVTGFLMLGFDTDGKDIFDRTVRMAREIELDDANLYILTPYPGTKIHEQFKREGRLLENKPRLNFGWANAVFKPKNMTPEELEAGVQGAIRELSVYFRNKLPMRVAERFTWLFKHPRMMLAMASGGFKRNIAGGAS